MALIRGNDNGDLAAHVAAPDPHAQYLLERVFPLLSLGQIGKPAQTVGAYGETPFNANTWNPNQGQAHASAVNIAAIGANFGNSNLPIGNYPGIIVEFEPYISASQINKSKLQFFSYEVNGLLFTRRQINGVWQPWGQLVLNNTVTTWSAQQNFTAGLAIGDPALAGVIKKILSVEREIDPPAIAGGSVSGINIPLPGAAVGDFVQIAPVQADLWSTGIWPFEFPAVVSAPNNIALFVRNDWSGSLDLLPFKIRIMVWGF
jgi:hypothetical protein